MKFNKEQKRDLSIEVLSVDEEKRTVDYVISSEAVDSFGTVFLSDKWRMDRYNANPIVTYNHHDHTNDPDDALGTSEIRFEEGKMIARVFFEPADINPKAEKVFQKSKLRTLRGASIRANVFEADWGWPERNISEDTLVFSDQELVAWSIVTIPSNPEALARTEKSLEAIRSACPKPQHTNDGSVGRSDDKSKASTSEQVEEGDKKRTLSRFEAQTIINENVI